MHNAVSCVGLIPARLSSRRLPGKPLALIAGIPMVVHVAMRAQMAEKLHSVIVCTDSQEIADVCQRFKIAVCITQAHHHTGTDRIGEAAAILNLDPKSIVIDIQGDEPLIDPNVIDLLIDRFSESDHDIMLPYLEFADRRNINVVKIAEHHGRVLFMSREDIPSSAYNSVPLKKHLSVVAFRNESLRNFCSMAASPLEKIENIELLRAIENGLSIGTFPVKQESFSVDIFHDLWRANQIMHTDKFYKIYVKNLLGTKI
jgi:3-deoxy-manno-octulosonate cytidylyltransferase (CMP-KDO synthetase)